MSVNRSGWKPSAPTAATGEAPATTTGNRALMLEEPLIFEIGDSDTTGVDFDPPRNGEGESRRRRMVEGAECHPSLVLEVKGEC